MWNEVRHIRMLSLSGLAVDAEEDLDPSRMDLHVTLEVLEYSQQSCLVPVLPLRTSEQKPQLSVWVLSSHTLLKSLATGYLRKW